jgi:DNA-binding XRE family transcriptional regulator
VDFPRTSDEGFRFFAPCGTFGENLATALIENLSRQADLPIFSTATKLLRLKKKGRMKNIPLFEKNSETLANCLRIHRRRIGLSQEELGRLLGYHDESAVAKHERFKAMPPFLIALGYEVMFQVPISELFPGVAQTVALGIETRLAAWEQQLRKGSDGETLSASAKRKLEWLEARRAATGVH